MQPQASRPYMPGYGIDDDADGLLTWVEALRRLTAARNFWLATVRPDGRPHLMPVWAVWHEDALWFSSSLGSRKIRNLQAEPRCSLSTEDGDRPLVIEGRAEIVTDLDRIAAFLAASNAKYKVDYGIDFLDPAVNASVRVAPDWAFALDEQTFTTSPTRWRFTQDQ
jgi:PPOX class probable F420-dependent enzyme